MSDVKTEIESSVNELYAKTKVIQKFSNATESPLELKIYVFKKTGVVFSSFQCQIGDSIKVKSKVIKKEKAEKKYTDSIASGNAAIFVSDDPEDENRIIINMGNIPAKTEVTFESEFIHPIQHSQHYQFELFRNLPIFVGKDRDFFDNKELKGKINIHTKNEIYNINNTILMRDLKIIEQKYENEQKTKYLIIYQIEKLPRFSWYDSDYIPSSQIYFDLKMKEPFIYTQKSSLNNDETNYLIQYLYKSNEKNDEIITNPALFIFLVDQSGSMSGSRIEIASKALQLFIQSLPAGSYYQIIGFGSSYKKYDTIPKEYNKENIKETLKMLEKLDASLGGTELKAPLEDIYNSIKDYEKTNLPRNIFLLTDGEIWDKKIVLELIEKNSNKFTVYSIGIGNSFDEDLIKNAGVIGKGNYNFCKDLNNLNSIIASEINKATCSYISNLQIKTNLDEKNILKNLTIPNILRDNSIVDLYYIIDSNNSKIDKIEMDIKYIDSTDNKNYEKKYEISPEVIEKGEDLSKIIINNYILNNKNLTNDEKLNLALKYQIFTDNTSLFAQVELSDKINEEMKLQIIGNKENNVIKEVREKRYYEKEMLCCAKSCDIDCAFKCDALCDCDDEFGDCDDDDDDRDCFRANNYSNNYKNEEKECKKCEIMACCEEKNNAFCDEGEDEDDMALGDCFGSSNNYKDEKNEEKDKCSSKKEEKEEIKKVEFNNIDIDKKENIMKLINTQDFIDGYWEDNEYTKKIKEKYLKEYDLLKGLKTKNINDRIALTILVIYFINKEHSELLADLLMILKKAKIFIQKETKDNYENIMKEIGIN